MCCASELSAGLKRPACKFWSGANTYRFSFKHVKRFLQAFVFLAPLFVTVFLSLSFWFILLLQMTSLPPASLQINNNNGRKKVSIPVRKPYGSDKYQRKPSSLSKISSHHPLNPLAVPQISSNFHTVGSL